jgi:asparagine synthetase B (glutamine-hydrolysing)
LHAYYNFLLKEHIRRGTFGGNIYSNFFYETRVPTLDNDLVDFAFQIPISLKKNRALYRNTFAQYYPELAKIPRDGTGLPLDVSNTTLEINRYKRKLLQKINKFPLNNLIPELNRKSEISYTNYKKWFRNELSKDIEDILLTKKPLGRGIYSEDGLRKMLNYHYYKRENHSNLILQLLNLEYFFKNFFD